MTEEKAGMPWNNQGGGNWQSGGGGRRNGPWGSGPQGGGNGGGGGGGGPTPDLEEILRRGGDRFKNVFPRGTKGGPGGFGPVLPLLALLIAAAVYLASGLYQVEPDELGVVTRFGRYDRITQPGLNYHLPWPVEEVQKPRVTQQRSVDIGFNARRDVPGESLMLTGDENIVDVDFTVLWVISSAPDFLFNVQNPESTVKAIAESAMREVVGRNNLEDILTQSRARVESEVRDLMQVTPDEYGAGFAVNEVQMQKVDPPEQVIEAFRDVQAARQDQERLRNEAEAYANQVLPEARGSAEQIKQEAAAYRERVVAEAQGGAARFTSIYNEYRQAPDVTRQRIFLETMERVLGGMTKVVIDGEASGQSGVVPYLPLPEVQRRRQSGTSEGETQ